MEALVAGAEVAAVVAVVGWGVASDHPTAWGIASAHC